MERVQRSLVKAAPWNVPVLLSGESGVGKEIVAPELHRLSPLPSELVESELFGYEKGAFTGAFRSKPGKFEMARGLDPSAPEPESTTTLASPATLAAGRRGAPLLLADTRA